MTLPANKLRNIRRRVNRARNFPTNTCPASRHMHTVADMWARGSSAEQAYGYEHIAVSLYSVLESLWKARTEIAQLRNQVETGKAIVAAGVDLMSSKQVGKWSGVRSFLEQDADAYSAQPPNA